MKFDYETNEMKIKKLRVEIDKLNKKHNAKADELKNNALQLSLSEIKRQKQDIQKIVDAKAVIQKDIDKLKPCLFED